MSEIFNSTLRINVFFQTAIVLLLLMFAYSLPSFAQTQSNAPLKESFIERWEKHIESLPTTEVFEKTDIPNIYKFKTNLFPYTGQLELLNVVIDKDIDYYYDYDLDADALLKGVAEVKLTNLDDDFFHDHSYSLDLWEEKHFLFYIEENNRWLTAEDLKKRNNKTDGYGHYDDYGAAPSSGCAQQKFLKRFLPLGALILILLFTIIAARKHQKIQTEKFDLSIEQQKESIEAQKQGLELAKQAMDIQKEQIELLRKLADK